MATTFDIKKLKYDIDQVLGHFELKTSMECVILDKWLGVKVADDYTIPQQLERKRQRLVREGAMWNEEELKMHFLSIVFDCADCEVPDRIKLFYERSLSSTIKNIVFSVICDALLASPLGFNTPNKPYFFLQEFKKGKKSQDDAEGQMLMAMLIAQELNKDDNPVYGCYVQGKDWYFSTLHQKNYCYSRVFDATQPLELAQIIHILQNLKNIIKL